MDVVINAHSGALHKVADHLRRRGIIMIDHEHLLERSTYGRNYGPPKLALAYEYAYDLILTCSEALRTWLPRAAVSVDKFHLVKLGNDMVTTVRQRLARTHRGRRGRKDDPAWAHRMLLLRGGDTLTPRAWERLERVFRTDDPTDELSASWGIKEQLRRLLATDTLAQAWQERMRMGYFVQIANMPEATKLYDTVVTWWDAIEVLIVTGATTAKVEAGNTGIKNIKRTGRGFRNAENYRTRILLTSAARTVA